MFSKPHLGEALKVKDPPLAPNICLWTDLIQQTVFFIHSLLPVIYLVVFLFISSPFGLTHPTSARQCWLFGFSQNGNKDDIYAPDPGVVNWPNCVLKKQAANLNKGQQTLRTCAYNKDFFGSWMSKRAGQNRPASRQNVQIKNTKASQEHNDHKLSKFYKTVTFWHLYNRKIATGLSTQVHEPSQQGISMS